ncbi:MAG: LLM class oxidoreductase [Acidovorax sp.]|nr:LLM class oxidoreductase [Acidovorax sp.]
MVGDLTSHEPAPKGWSRLFQPGKMSIGLAFPIESYAGCTPSMQRQIERARTAEALGFAALWARDVPLLDPQFGDVGQIYDPWIWLSTIAAHTTEVALATGSIILPLRHPIHTAKSAASLDVLSGERLVLGVGSGDRPIEFTAFGFDHSRRGERFRDVYLSTRAALGGCVLASETTLTGTSQATLLPLPRERRLPMLVTGRSQQTVDWIAVHAEGWLTYPRAPAVQAMAVREWANAVLRAGGVDWKPVAQSLYVDLLADAAATPVPIHLGYRLGRFALIELLQALQAAGINHVYLNLRFSSRPIDDVIQEIGLEVLPLFGGAAVSERGLLLSRRILVRGEANIEMDTSGESANLNA